MKLPAGLKIVGGFRTKRISKCGRIIRTPGAFGQSHFQRVENENRRQEKLVNFEAQDGRTR